MRCHFLRVLERAPGDEAMDVRMVLQVLAPGMEHGDKADLGAEMTSVGGDPTQRLGGRLEQDRVNRLLVLEGDFGSRRRQREHDMEIRRGQQFALPLSQPRGAGRALAFRAIAGPGEGRGRLRHEL